MSESTEWQIQGSRVYGNGESYNVTNRITALELCKTLNHYHQITQEHQQTSKKLDTITRDIIRLNMTISTVHEEIQTIRKGLEQ